MRAKVTQTDPAAGRVKVVLLEDGAETDWLEMLAHEYNMPAVGEVCRVLLDEGQTTGVYLGPTYTTEQAPPAASAGTCVKQMAGVTLSAEGGTLTIKGDLVMQGNLSVTGNITAAGSVRAASIEEVGG